jgi:hypothetical protein
VIGELWMRGLDRVGRNCRTKPLEFCSPSSPEHEDAYYAVWVECKGADKLSAISPEPIDEASSTSVIASTRASAGILHIAKLPC